jgi:hypothetical protein
VHNDRFAINIVIFDTYTAADDIFFGYAINLVGPWANEINAAAVDDIDSKFVGTQIIK